MFCTKCGKQVADGNKFCTGCGSLMAPSNKQGMVPPSQAVQQPQQPVVAQKMQGTQAPTSVETTPKKKSNMGLVIGLLSGLVAILAIVAAVLILVKLGKLEIPGLEFLSPQKGTVVEEKEDDENDADVFGEETEAEEETEASSDENAEEAQADTQTDAQDENTDSAQTSVSPQDIKAEMETTAYQWGDMIGTQSNIWAEKDGRGWVYDSPDFSFLSGKTIASHIDDYDADGVPELLEIQADNQGYVILSMYEYDAQNHMLGKQASWGGRDRSPVIPGFVEGTLDIFAINHSIYLEESECAYMFADGVNISILQLGYDGTSFNVESESFYCGSDGQYSDEYMRGISSLGATNADWESLLGLQYRVHDFLGGVQGICEFYTEYTVDTAYVFDWIYDNTAADTKAVANLNIRNVTNGKVEIGAYMVSAEEAGGNDFIFPDSDRRFLDEDDLRILTKETSRIAINELYARHGYVFTTDEMIEYFGNLEWYQNTRKDPDFDGDRSFNQYEMANKELMIKYAESKGWR